MSVERPEISIDETNLAIRELQNRMCLRLDKKGTGSFAGIHEILGIITEEYHELIEAVHVRDGVKGELLDIAVGCIFAVACLNSGTVKERP